MVTEPQVENDKTGRTDAEPAQTEQAQAQGGSVEEEQSEAEADDSDSDPASLGTSHQSSWAAFWDRG